jgi:hypothetical protein
VRKTKHLLHLSNKESFAMNRIRSSAHKRPLLFGLGITVIYILMLIVSAVLGAALPGEGYAAVGGLLGRVASTAVLLALLAGLGWLRSAGFASMGSRRTWLLLGLALPLALLGLIYALQGNLSLSFLNAELPAAVIMFIGLAAFMEQVAFRGLILHALVRAWGNTHRGRVMAVVAAALLFGALHVLDLLSGRPVDSVIAQAIETIILGVWLGALVEMGRSIYPAFVFHTALNLVGYQLIGGQGLEPAPAAWLLLGALILPLAAIGLIWLRRAPQPAPAVRAMGGLSPN